ncbi:UNVERIFIED_CONTAM: hypothetical protein RMT77_015516 [Armadillidium vulgare]
MNIHPPSNPCHQDSQLKGSQISIRKIYASVKRKQKIFANEKMSITTRKKPHCSFCKNHGLMSSTKQHHCKYKLRCKCILCELTKKAQVIMCHQQRVWRHNNQKHLNETPIKGQKCDNCRNHLKFVKKSNHVDCEYKDCECNYCKLTHKRREIMKHIQRARRLNVTVDENIQEGDDVDVDSKEKASLNQLKSLYNDKEVDILMEATLSKEMESLTPPSSVSPIKTDTTMDPKATSSSFSPTSHSVYRGNEYQNIFGKGSKESCNLSLSSPDSTSSLGRTRERRYSDPYQSRSKIRGYDENPMSRRFHISPISFQDQQSKSHDDDVKPILFDTPARNPLDLSTDARNFVGGTDSRSSLNSHCPRIPNTLQSSLALNQFIPYPSPLDLRNYTTPHNPFLYPPYLEQNSNRVAGRQPIVRPEPINPSRSNRSTLPLSPFFLRPPSDTVQGALSSQFWDNAYLPAPYPPNFLSIELYKAMQFRNPVIPYHVKVPSE